MDALDALLLVALVVGNLLALPIWWWLIGTPIVRLCKRLAATQRRRIPHRTRG